MRWYSKMSNRERLSQLYTQAVAAVQAESIIQKSIRCTDSELIICDQHYPWHSFQNLYCLTVGKAGLGMAQACEKILGDNIHNGVAISHQTGDLDRMTHFSSTHPLVSHKSMESAEALIRMMEQMQEDDLFIFCLSGGASAMIEKPIEGLSLEDFQKVSKALLGSGIDIKALNSVRKSISQIKGGKLASHTKANGIVLVLSDVIGGDLHTIGSAPMRNGRFPHHIIGNNRIALETIKTSIEGEVETVEIMTTTLDQSSAEAARYIADIIQRYDQKYASFCLLFGGETTTEVKGNGQGGRNQELALRLLLAECVTEKIAILCAGSDGIDGNSPATGAVVDRDIYTSMKEKHLDPKVYLDNSDSYGFFSQLGYDLTTGATGTNVMDFIMVLKS